MPYRQTLANTCMGTLTNHVWRNVQFQLCSASLIFVLFCSWGQGTDVLNISLFATIVAMEHTNPTTLSTKHILAIRGCHRSNSQASCHNMDHMHVFLIRSYTYGKGQSCAFFLVLRPNSMRRSLAETWNSSPGLKCADYSHRRNSAGSVYYSGLIRVWFWCLV